MAFEIKDYFMHYTKKGEPYSLFNVAREDPTSGAEYYAFLNDEGSYVFQRVTTSGTLRIYKYYASKTTTDFTQDWTDRAVKTYGEYYELFQQGG